MQFQITFKNIDGDYAISKPETSVGLNFLDYAKLSTKKPIKLNQIQGHIERLREDLIIQVSEKFARTSEKFKKESHLIVYVPPEALNKYVEIEIEISGNNIIPVYRVQEHMIIKDWVNAGYPIHWEVK